MIDFPAIHEGREIQLCWKLGEECVDHWHEINSGIAGRRSVAELLRLAA
ncbi:MAG: DUF2203 family protein [Candidatus Competibacteraceae bacterium]|nr:DUF2203 family protein [Candidatus Competibacteraceae bacterium]